MQIDDDAENTVERPVESIEVEEKIDFPLVARGTYTALDEFEQLVTDDYERFKKELIYWLLTEGKDTYRGEGYAAETIRTTHYKIEDIFRWHWDQQSEYTLTFSPAHGTDLLDFLMKRTPHPDSTVKDFEKACKRLFEFFRKKKNRELPEWDHDIPIEPSRGSKDHVKDRFYPEEMSRLYEASLKLDTVKSYNTKSMTAAERDRIRVVLSDRLNMPKKDIGREEFKNAPSWKFPSIVAVTADTGLRPIEVSRAKPEWMDLQKRKMVIPAEDATKSDTSWVCQLSEKSITALRKWTREREAYSKYEDTDLLWVTRQCNPYKSRGLNHVLGKLKEEAGIEDGNRNLTWYSFRHGVATVWVNEKGLGRAQEQLRHNKAETTMKYDRSGSKNDPHMADGMW